MTRFLLPDTVVRFVDPLTRAEQTGTIVRLLHGPITTYEIDHNGTRRHINVADVRPA